MGRQRIETRRCAMLYKSLIKLILAGALLTGLNSFTSAQEVGKAGEGEFTLGPETFRSAPVPGQFRLVILPENRMSLVYTPDPESVPPPVKSPIQAAAAS